MNVLILLPNLRASNGVASFAMTYFRALDHDKVHMDFALVSERKSPYYDEIRDAGGKIFVLPPVKKLAAHVRECRRILSEGHYDVVHNNTLLAMAPMMWCAKAAGVPVRVLHSHNSKLGETPKKETRNRRFLPVLMAAATDHAACSRVAAEAMFKGKDWTLITNVIPAEKFHFDAEKRREIRRFMSCEDKKVIATIGRAAEQKNPFFALDVIAGFSKDHPDCEYWWIGSGPLDKPLAAAVEEMGLTNVRLLGSRSDVPDLYQAIDLFFLPSLFEGLPITAVEAQAVGLPSVISSSVTDELVYTDLVKFVDLDAPLDSWVAALDEQLARQVDRASYADVLRGSAFCAEGAGATLERYYEERLGR